MSFSLMVSRSSASIRRSSIANIKLLLNRTPMECRGTVLPMGAVIWTADVNFSLSVSSEMCLRLKLQSKPRVWRC